MSHSVRVLCHPALAPGFRLAGVPSHGVSTGTEAAEWIAHWSAQPEVGVVLVEESLFAALPAQTRHTLERAPVPVVVPFPGPIWREREPAEAFILELLRNAIGYRVRLR